MQQGLALYIITIVLMGPASALVCEDVWFWPGMGACSRFHVCERLVACGVLEGGPGCLVGDCSK
jgi:hypothetical protein